MSDLLRLAIGLSIPILVFGALLWLLLYSAIRMGLRHEISRAQRRKVARPAAETQRTPPAPRPRVVVSRDGQPTRLRPPATHPVNGRTPSTARTPVAAGQRRAAS